jgi:hypothetical protein
MPSCPYSVANDGKTPAVVLVLLLIWNPPNALLHWSVAGIGTLLLAALMVAGVDKVYRSEAVQMPRRERLNRLRVPTSPKATDATANADAGDEAKDAATDRRKA